MSVYFVYRIHSVIILPSISFLATHLKVLGINSSIGNLLKSVKYNNDSSLHLRNLVSKTIPENFWKHAFDWNFEAKLRRRRKVLLFCFCKTLSNFLDYFHCFVITISGHRFSLLTVDSCLRWCAHSQHRRTSHYAMVNSFEKSSKNQTAISQVSWIKIISTNKIIFLLVWDCQKLT